MTAEKDVQVARKKTFFFTWGVPQLLPCHDTHQDLACQPKVIIKIIQMKNVKIVPGPEASICPWYISPRLSSRSSRSRMTKKAQFNLKSVPDPEGQHCHQLPPPRDRESQDLQLCSWVQQPQPDKMKKMVTNLILIFKLTKTVIKFTSCSDASSLGS